jgi:hypothetical protein
MSRTAKVLLVLGAVVGLVGFLVIVDLGVNAGRIHYGVEVEDIDVGGLTAPEAFARLDERGELLKKSFAFGAPGVTCEVVPKALGWGPQPSDTMKTALDVGRAHFPFGALADRVKAWIGGVTVGWAGAVKDVKVEEFLDECESKATGQGLDIARDALRRALEKAIVTWPRPILFRLPLERPA